MVDSLCSASGGRVVLDSSVARSRLWLLQNDGSFYFVILSERVFFNTLASEESGFTCDLACPPCFVADVL